MKHLGLLVALIAICKSALSLNYCVPAPTNGVNNYKLTHVGMLDIDTNLNVNSAYLLIPDSTFNVTCYMRPGYIYTLDLSVGAFTNRTLAAWIDWNRDTTFSSSEKLGEFVSNGISSISFQVPLDCTFGKLRLRVRVSNGTSIDACTGYGSGQTIDFTITTLIPRYHDDFDYYFYRSCDGRYIDEVHLANLNNIHTGSDQGPIFGDYTYKSANVQCCTLYNLIIASHSNVAGEHLSVFIDLNDNGSFTDMNEFVTDGYVIIGANIDTLPLTIPFTSGSRRMRINLGDEYEDYMVNITPSSTPDSLVAHIGHFLHDDEANPIWSCAGPVSFYDWSCGVPTTRTWQITGPSNFTSNNQNPSFNLPVGSYTVILTVSNSFGSDADTAYLSVVDPVATMGLWGTDTVGCSGSSLDLYPPWIDDGSGGANCSYATWSTGFILPSISVDTAGTYMVKVEDCSFAGCPTYDTINVQFSPNNYSVTGGGSICTGSAGVTVGLSDSQNGISYQLKLNGNPVGNLVYGNGSAISFGSQNLAGTYTVEASDTTLGCVNDMTGNAIVVIGSTPTQYSVTGGGTICLGNPGLSVGLSNSQNSISYQLKRNGTSTGSPVVGNGSAISFGAQTLAGNYTVVATNNSAGCTANMTGTVTIIVTPSPTQYSVTGGGTICTGTGASVGLSNSQIGISYQLKRNGTSTGSPVLGNGSAINFGAQAVAGNYSVVATDTSAGCTANMTGTVSIIIAPGPTQYSVTGGGTICLGSSGASVGLSDSQNGISYQLKRNGTSTGSPVLGNSSAISFGTQALAGSFSVVATDTSSGCTSNMTGIVTIIITPGPTLFSVTGGGTICQSSAGVSVGLSNSQTGMSYQLKRNGIPTGSAVNGNGSAIGFGAQTIAGTYSVSATDTSLGCTVNMNGNAVVVVNPKPNIYNVTGGGHYCAGSSAPIISLSNSQSGVNYSLLLNGVSTGVIVAGNNSLINFPVQTASGTYTVVGTNATSSCSVSMQGNQQITADAIPAVYNLTGGGTYCNGVGVQLTLSNSTNGVNYELFNNNISTGVIIAGTGSAINFQNIQAGGTFTVVATNVSNCSATMNGSPVITSSAPSIYNLTGGGSYCSGTGIQLTLSNSTNGITYELYRNNVATGTIINGNGAAINFQNLQTPGTYTVVATNSSSCTATMNGSSLVSAATPPAQFAFTGDANYCQGQTGADVSLIGSEINVNYQLYINHTISGTPIPGTGDSISFGTHNTLGNYTVIATSAGNCSTSFTDTISVNMYSSPSTFPLSTVGHYCPNSIGAEIFLSNSLAGNDYQLLYGGIPQGQPVVGTGSQVSFGYYLNSGVYDVTVTENVHGCTATGSDTLTLVMDVVQQAQINSLPSTVCIFDAPITLTGTPVGGIFTVDTSVTSVFEPALLGSGSHWITYVYSDTANGCSSTASDTIYVDICTGIRQKPVSNAVTVYPNPASDHITIDFAEPLDREISFELFSTYGQLIRRYSDIKCNPDCRFTISLENLSNGIYWLRVYDSIKLIKNISIIKHE